MSTLNERELKNISVMYEGDKRRDATSKIRGFLFQDYVMIKCLLNSDVKCVCSEYLEDVDVIYENNTFEFIQVKYYPKTDPNMKEISTDLYYQYLRLKMLHSTFETKPSLYIHRNEKVEKPTVGEMEEYTGQTGKLPETETYLGTADPENWLRTNVNILEKKEKQKEKLFSTMASKTSLEEFIKKLNICHKSDIKQYKKDLMVTLAKVYPDSSGDKGEEDQQQILLGLEKSSELLAGIQQKLLQESEEQKLRDSYQQILNALGYDFKDEMIQQTYEKVKNLISRSFEVSDFSYEVLMSKINVLDGVLANKKAEILKQELDECNKKNRDLDIEIEKLRRLEDIADQRAKDIRNIVEKLSKEEYEKVGPAIGKFYNKLARFNIGEGINIVQEDKGLSLVDDKGKNIVNVLSNGQISVFMLAHFFAGINSRNDCEKMKIYFIDDLTSCMDDVNMLAFMDLLKYQISSKATMKQLFFITCDERISKLLKYKLDGRGIELRELLEADFKC